VHFRRLRLVGFKSFVDPTELLIEPGLTGIVGPNGCGKSNLVEALRWVMGETSPKKMRGSGMDDVIFAGTNTRPSRNIAEVALALDNRARRASSQFNESDEVEVTRRIERELGSDFRVNGRDVRARDVQRLFADAASGAHSTALVSQGEVGALIKAKPEDRRAILEEAAGITGLHSRRHEAELRLRAAETNLARLADIMAALDSQLRGLKQQARQASRYRNLSGHIRRTEATLLFLSWRKAAADVEAAQALLGESEAAVAAATSAAATATTELSAAAERLPALRQAEAEAAAALHRLKVAGEQLDRDEKAALDERHRLEAQIAQIESDTTREQARVRDAEEAIARLAGEVNELSHADANAAGLVADAAAAAAAARALTAAEEARVEKLAAEFARAEARVQGLTDVQRDCTARLQRIADRLRGFREERDRLMTEALAPAEAAVRDELERLRQTADAARIDFGARETERAAALEGVRAADAALQAAEAQLARRAAEEAALAALLKDGEPELWPPLIDAVTVAPGYEGALAAALGDDLNVAANEAAPMHWRRGLDPLAGAPALPAGAVPLSQFVTGPAVLSRRLSQVGVIDPADGARLQAELTQGQRLVSTGGALWRWDGFTVTAGAQTAALVRLNQRQRLTDLRGEIAACKPTVESVRATAGAARTAAERARHAEAAAREALWAADEALRAAREAHAQVQRESEARSAKISALGDGIVTLGIEQVDAGDGLRTATAELKALENRHETRKTLDKARLDLIEKRRALAEAEATLEGFRRASAARAGRLRAAESERDTWTARVAEANAQTVELARRRAASEEQLARTIAKPAAIAAERQALLSTIANAETVRNRAADELALADAAFKARSDAAKAADQALAGAREERIRRDGNVNQASERRADVERRTRQALDCAPAESQAIAEIKDDAELPAIDQVESRLQRLQRERETMGPVNLRAEQEAEEVNVKLTGMQTERADLEAAIAKLRHGIASLNREGRERLLEAFKQVDANFRTLFTQLFGGGRAHLALTEAEDPLDAGLEIMASPPGKRLQILSLLSGGEQALTATALLVAVFQANPAPLCVMDEVDAPLDDANVERFCNLVQAIARQTGTRFLLITHNPVTMARMDRLFGVTMAEQGVSQLVSVDLTRAEALRQTA